VRQLTAKFLFDIGHRQPATSHGGEPITASSYGHIPSRRAQTFPKRLKFHPHEGLEPFVEKPALPRTSSKRLMNAFG
jgi:hypothetical protein